MDGWTGNSAVKTVGRRFDFRNNCPSFTHCVGVDGYGVSTASIRQCSHTHSNKLYNDATDCSESSDVTGKR